MPKFTQQELEEIRDNTERIEQERMARGAAKGKSKQELDGSDSDEDDADSATKSKGTKKTGSRSKKSSKIFKASQIFKLAWLICCICWGGKMILESSATDVLNHCGQQKAFAW